MHLTIGSLIYVSAPSGGGGEPLGASIIAVDEIIQRATDGDQAAQQSIYEMYSERVHRLVLRIVGPTDADDVTQDVFVNVFNKMHTFRFGSEFGTWVHRLAVNDALQHLRRKRRRTAQSLDESHLHATSASAPSHDRAADLKELFETAFARLDVELRMILELKEVQKLSYAEIAEIVGIPEGTVGSRLNRARRELRLHLTSLGWEG